MNKYTAPFQIAKPVVRKNNKDYAYAIAVRYSVTHIGEDGTPDAVYVYEQNAFSKTILGTKKAVARRIGIDRHELIENLEIQFEWNTKLRHIKKILSVEVVELQKESV